MTGEQILGVVKIMAEFGHGDAIAGLAWLETTKGRKALINSQTPEAFLAKARENEKAKKVCI